jgi:hypothetical protein
MTAPNIVNVATITGSTSTVNLTTTSITSLVSNAASSNQVYKINSVIVANTNGTNACNFTLSFCSAASAGGTASPLASTISVPANASLIALDKSTSLYLPENTSLGVTAGTASVLQVTVSYEVIS